MTGTVPATRACASITLHLPVPPSANGLFANKKGGGRVKTKGYRAWRKEADACLFWQHSAWKGKQVKGPASLTIRIPRSTRGDASNRIKALEDFLVSRGITSDDRHNNRVTVERADVPCCVVTISPWEPPEYDGHDDFVKSLEVGYAAIRERMAKGGPGWNPK